MTNHTIAAIATPLGKGGFSVIRISGKDAITIADKVFVGSTPLSEKAGYTAEFGFTKNKNNEYIDECVATVFIAPKSFTGENVVELSCHGGELVTKKLLEAILDAGASLAGPGEFSKRAFLNGKIDLSKAEAIMSLINAKSENALKIAAKNKKGSVSIKMAELRHTLEGLLAAVSVFCDYPDDESMGISEDDFLLDLESLIKEIEELLKNYENGRLLTQGIDTAIIGKPNVGKSTLLNLLSGYDKAIVTDIPGTTRDVIESEINFMGLILRLYDTAGIRETNDRVEKIGVERSMEKLETADIALFMFEAGATPTADELALLEKNTDKSIVIVNKTDLVSEEIAALKDYSPIYISAKNGTGLDALKDKIKALLNIFDFDDTSVVVDSLRQKNNLTAALNSLKEAKDGLSLGIPLDAVGVLIDEGYRNLCEITGDKAAVDVANRVFSDFCVGK